jgi:hypothetical protein
MLYHQLGSVQDIWAFQDQSDKRIKELHKEQGAFDRMVLGWFRTGSLFTSQQSPANLMCICLLRGHLGQFDPITWVQDR